MYWAMTSLLPGTVPLGQVVWPPGLLQLRSDPTVVAVNRPAPHCSTACHSPMFSPGNIWMSISRKIVEPDAALVMVPPLAFTHRPRTTFVVGLVCVQVTEVEAVSL